ncbi:unnamed protein product, partial [Polarella glacialis]
EMTLTVYREAEPEILPGLGADDDTLQVRIERGANVGQLKARIFALYGLSPALQAFRRDVDSKTLGDQELLAYDEDGDVVHLRIGPNFAAGGIGGLLQGATEAMSSVFAAMEGQRQELERTEYTLSLLMPETAALPERRCRIPVMATARVAELLDMARLELNVEGEEPLALEFAGQKLPTTASVHALGLRDGDTVLVFPDVGRTD